MTKTMAVLAMVALAGCNESHERAPVDAGCVLTVPCVGTACPDEDLQEGLYFPCSLGTPYDAGPNTR